MAHARARGGLARLSRGQSVPARANLDRTHHMGRLKADPLRTTNGSLERCRHDKSRNAPKSVAVGGTPVAIGGTPVAIGGTPVAVGGAPVAEVGHETDRGATECHGPRIPRARVGPLQNLAVRSPGSRSRSAPALGHRTPGAGRPSSATALRRPLGVELRGKSEPLRHVVLPGRVALRDPSFSGSGAPGVRSLLLVRCLLTWWQRHGEDIESHRDHRVVTQ